MKARLLSAIAIAIGMGTVAPASATVIDAIYTGSVREAGSTPDDLGVFGPVGGSLGGHAFVATFELDTSKGSNRSTPTENYIMGGSTYGLDSPIIKATIEINGVTVTAGSGYSDAVQAFLGSSVANQQTHTTSDAAGNMMLLNVTDASFASVGSVPFTIDVPLTFNFDTSVVGFGEVAFRAGGIATVLDLTPTQLVYRFPSPDGPGAVPEPSTWAMMALGFAGLAYAGFRRRSRPGLA